MIIFAELPQVSGARRRLRFARLSRDVTVARQPRQQRLERNVARCTSGDRFAQVPSAHVSTRCTPHGRRPQANVPEHAAAADRLLT